MKKGDLKQEQVYNFLLDYMDNHSYPPSYREIAVGTNIKSTNSVKKYLDVLEQKNLITKSGTKNRSIEIVKKSLNLDKELVKVPLIGKVAAGNPILAFENFEDEFVMSKSIFGTSQELFMLKIAGDSMIDIGIDDGDLVVVKKQNTAENGDIVVAYIDGSATVKTFYFDGTQVRLQPQNALYRPIITKDCQILGKVLGCIKKF
ncbi:MAG: transcriptional repressor LexA [Clostridia bacterium]|nr:transcriptional repressor LexA [Clostridia bacterium]